MPASRAITTSLGEFSRRPWKESTRPVTVPSRSRSTRRRPWLHCTTLPSASRVRPLVNSTPVAYSCVTPVSGWNSRMRSLGLSLHRTVCDDGTHNGPSAHTVPVYRRSSTPAVSPSPMRKPLRRPGCCRARLRQVHGVPFEQLRVRETFRHEGVTGNETFGLPVRREDAHRAEAGLRRLEGAKGEQSSPGGPESLVVRLVAGI